MPPRSQQPSVIGASAFVTTLRDPGRNLVDRYKDDILGLADRLGVKLPKKPLQVMQEQGVYDPEKHGPIEPGLRDMVLEVCSLEVKSAVAVASRGGGKSYGVSLVEFFLWLLHGFDALNLGGSEFQADVVYQYIIGFIENDGFWNTLLRADPQREKTYTKAGNWIKVLTASHKQVRGQHAGGKRGGKTRGGILVIDEEAETEESIVDAALHTINTARPSVNIRASTFHNIGGSFQKVVDHHAEMGYKLYRWDIFDVCEGCDCVGECQSPEPCFREDHYDEYIDPDDGELKRRLVHRAYCNGRAMYADGWIPMEEILALWRRMRRNHFRWEVEAMGNRPSSKDFVIRDINKFADNVVTDSGASLYVHGKPIYVLVDWGTGAAGVQVWQEQAFGKHVLVESELMIDNNQTQVFGKILGLAKKYQGDFVEVAADIGGGGNYLNEDLRVTHRLPVRDVAFAEEKEGAVAVWNSINEAGKIVVPSEFTDFIEQVQGWKRRNGRIAKGNDHLCDAAICYFSKFIDPMGFSDVRVPPRSFSMAPTATPVTVQTGNHRGKHQPSNRVPVVATLARRTKRRAR